MNLKGKLVLIPGAPRPIGRAIARRFALAGATLILPVYDWPESIAEMEEELSRDGHQWYAHSVDLRSSEEVAAFAAAVRQRFGAVDYLINNIERGGMPIVHGSYSLPHNRDQWELEMATTLTAKWLLYNHFSPMIKGRPGGAVVNISSVAALVGRSGPAAPFFSDGYSAANRGVHSFTTTWAREAAPDIRVNELMLGLIRSRHGEGTRGWAALSETERKEIIEAIPLHRTGNPLEVADAVYFLAVEATYLTGTILRMDGGLAMGSATVPPLPPGILG
jgi:3-oxoacyl-[acyl-carrier protein] reductase